MTLHHVPPPLTLLYSYVLYRRFALCIELYNGRGHERGLVLSETLNHDDQKPFELREQIPEAMSVAPGRPVY